jgi:epoxyqueuosine reductase
MALLTDYTQFVKEQALALGFSAVGISRAEFLEEHAKPLERWLNNNMHGEMAYMANHFDMRLDPRLLVDGAKSVISLMYNYYPQDQLSQSSDSLKIAKYAYGEDYHFVVKDRLKILLERMRQKIGDIHGRAFVDSAPVLERAWAMRSGLGWMGKNTNIIRKGQGSYFFLCELIVDIPFEYDTPQTDHCGTCTACIDACPTNAITHPQQVDGSKCISYFTIELKEQIPQDMKGKFENWIFGCDICQDVCPWNRFAKPHQEPRFNAPETLKNADNAFWIEMTEDVFGEIFRKSPLKRTKYNGLKRNIDFVIHAHPNT